MFLIKLIGILVLINNLIFINSSRSYENDVEPQISPEFTSFLEQSLRSNLLRSADNPNCTTEELKGHASSGQAATNSSAGHSSGNSDTNNNSAGTSTSSGSSLPTGISSVPLSNGASSNSKTDSGAAQKDIRKFMQQLYVAQAQVQLEALEIQRAQTVAAASQQSLEEASNNVRIITAALHSAQQTVASAAMKAQTAQLQLAAHDQLLFAARQRVDALSAQMVGLQAQEGIGQPRLIIDLPALLKKLQEPLPAQEKPTPVPSILGPNGDGCTNAGPASPPNTGGTAFKQKFNFGTAGTVTSIDKTNQQFYHPNNYPNINNYRSKKNSNQYEQNNQELNDYYDNEQVSDACNKFETKMSSIITPDEKKSILDLITN